MLYKYIATTPDGEKKNGSVDAPNMEIAVRALQGRNLIVVSVDPAGDVGFFTKFAAKFETIKMRDIVILSRQISTLFEAKVPAVESLKLLAGEAENPAMSVKLHEVIDDIQGGISLSQAMSRHPDVFSKFYVSMVRSGEESGKLDEIFSYLADYLERTHDLTMRARNALIYPVFVIVSLILVFVLMMVFVMPRMVAVLQSFSAELPFYTRMIVGISNFFVDFGLFLLAGIVAGVVFLWNYWRTESGRETISNLQVTAPIVGPLFRKFFLSRFTDNLETSLSSGISMVRALEIASDVVGNHVYQKILLDTANDIKGGASLSTALAKYKMIPPIVYQMVKTGEETGRMNYILKNLAKFYKKEVDLAIDNVVTLIEPALIIILGLGVGFFIVTIIGPIYNVTAGI